MKRVRQEQPFATEADLCAAFIEWAKPQGWTGYPETEAWDVLLVHGEGSQIGVQAKLRMNIHVLAQAVPAAYQACRDTGPDFIAVLVPDGKGANGLCGALGVTLLAPREYRSEITFSPDLPTGRAHGRWPSYEGDWHYRNYAKRCPLPKYVPDVAAGASAPVQLTKWKIGALEIAATAELRGHVTRADFRRFGVDPRRWIDSRWMIPGDRAGEFKVVANFAKQHPQVYPQVLTDVREWLSKSEGIAPMPSEVPA